MKQLKIDLPDGSPVLKIYSLVNSENYANDNRKALDENKSAKRRLRKQLLMIEKLCKEGRKALLSKGK